MYIFPFFSISTPFLQCRSDPLVILLDHTLSALRYCLHRGICLDLSCAENYYYCQYLHSLANTLENMLFNYQCFMKDIKWVRATFSLSSQFHVHSRESFNILSTNQDLFFSFKINLHIEANRTHNIPIVPNIFIRVHHIFFYTSSIYFSLTRSF